MGRLFINSLIHKIMTTENIFASMGADQAHLEKVESSLFVVEKLQLQPALAGYDAPEAFGIYKGTGGKALGVMGKQFDPMQPKEFMDNIIHTSHTNGVDLNLGSLKFSEYQGGSKIEFSVSLEPISFMNAAGKEDTTETKILFSTSYDGSQSNSISLYTYRQVCSNGMMGWGLDSTLKGKNTTGGKNKILTYGNEVMKIMSKTEDYKQKLIALNSLKVGKTQINAFLTSLLGYDVTSEEIHPNSKKVLDKLLESIDTEFTRTGKTMFGLLQGVTHYTNHIADLADGVTRDEYIRFRTGAKTNTDAQRLAFATLK